MLPPGWTVSARHLAAPNTAGASQPALTENVPVSHAGSELAVISSEVDFDALNGKSAVRPMFLANYAAGRRSGERPRPGRAD